MRTPNAKDFIEFINNQPPEQTISHLNWNSCSVGEYMRAIGLDNGVDIPFWLERGNNELYEKLRFAYSNDMDTYKDLQDFLATL